jgi:hypothetical protein
MTCDQPGHPEYLPRLKQWRQLAAAIAISFASVFRSTTRGQDHETFPKIDKEL